VSAIATRLGACAPLAALALCIAAAPAQAGERASAAQAGQTRYSLVHGCYALRSRSLDRLVAKSVGGGYAAAAGDASAAEAFRMQATALGRYLLYGKQQDFLAAGSGDRAESASGASESTEWRVDEAGGGAFRIVLQSTGRALAVSGQGGDLVLTDAGSAGDAGLFAFEPAEGCPKYPEAEVNAVGTPAGGPTPYGQVRGLVDGHLHMMAFEFLGGSVRCGRPWHPYGIPYAMVDCPDHGPGGVGAALENTISYGNPVGTHDTVGWPTFKDWPAYRSLTHEQVYYKWMERAWRGGLRMFTNLMVDNEALCKVYPLKRNPCNEMNTIRLEIRRIRELEDYIDAQSGGPGKGWFRIVRDPFEARRVINQGKLAVMLGMETSQPFDCDVYNGQPLCDRKIIDDWMNELYAAGIRQMELVNKFDNALVGVAGDAGSTGVVVNGGNRLETGRFWQFGKCQDQNNDNPQSTAAPEHNTDTLMSALALYTPPGTTPVYGEPPHCNVVGLSDLGEYVIRDMVKRKMLFDPDHMSVIGRRQALAVIESADYSGVMSSHSWSTDDAYPRIYRSGGFVTPYAGSSTNFVKEWRKVRAMRSARYYFGFGYGADMNGFGGQGAPRGADAPNAVKYPFKSFDGKVTIDKQRSGERVYDINVDGVAHYGLYPDWLEDLRMLAGDQIVEDMARGAEAYLQTWERANGVPGPRCRSVHEGFTSVELGRVRLGANPEQVLRATNQPVSRPGRTYRWCVGQKKERTGEVIAVFSPAERVGLVASTAPRHRHDGIGTGTSASRLRGRATRAGDRLWSKRMKGGSRLFYGVRGGKVEFVALASRAVASKRSELLRYLRLAKLR
jgi:hypothetical protein